MTSHRLGQSLLLEDAAVTFLSDVAVLHMTCEIAKSIVCAHFTEIFALTYMLFGKFLTAIESPDVHPSCGAVFSSTNSGVERARSVGMNVTEDVATLGLHFASDAVNSGQMHDGLVEINFLNNCCYVC